MSFPIDLDAMQSASSPSTRTDYRPDIDGLRAVAIIAVMSFHFLPRTVTGGFVGVDIFFVISGFLISRIIIRDLDGGAFSFVGFYGRRARRIFPALAVMLIACLLFGSLILLADELNQLGWHAAAGSVFLSNVLLWHEVGYFDVAADAKPLLHLWSLGIEEQFYLVWPLFMWACWRVKRLFPALLAVATIASFGANLVLTSQDPSAAFYLPFTRFWELFAGAALAWCAPYARRLATPLVADITSALGMLVIVLSVWNLDKDIAFPGFWAVLPVLGAVLIIAAGPQALLNRHLLSSRPVVWIGHISFPLYLWHWPIITFARIFYQEEIPNDIKASCLVLTVCLAWLTTAFVERPFRQRTSALPFRTAGISAALLVVGLIGVAVGKTDFTQSHVAGGLVIARRDAHVIGASDKWFRGKDDWLFLGNAYHDTVAKLKLAREPAKEEIDAIGGLFSELASVAAQSGTRVLLIVGPDKTSVYPEYLPAELSPSPIRYVSAFLDRLRSIPNLTVYDPTADFRALKAQEGLIYWRTDTHWNQKGALLALQGGLAALHLPAPTVQFRNSGTHSGDLITLAGLADFPVREGDNWEALGSRTPGWTVVEDVALSQTLRSVERVDNPSPTAPLSAWVVGDSFAQAMQPYINAAFARVDYLGHWSQTLASIAQELARAEQKPDLVIVVRVERSF